MHGSWSGYFLPSPSGCLQGFLSDVEPLDPATSLPAFGPIQPQWGLHWPCCLILQPSTPLHPDPSSSDFPVLCLPCFPDTCQLPACCKVCHAYCPSLSTHWLHEEDSFFVLIVYLQGPRTIFNTLFSAFQKCEILNTIICALFLFTQESFLRGLIYVEDYSGYPSPFKVLLERTWYDFIKLFWRKLVFLSFPLAPLWCPSFSEHIT